MRIPTERGHLDDGVTRDQVFADVRAACRSAPDGSPAHLVVHVHGGLVDKAAGESIAHRLDGEYRAAGAVPYFLIWQSGLLETVRQSGADIVGERLFTVLRDRIGGVVRRKFAQSAGDRASGVLPPLIAAPADADPVPPPGLTDLSPDEQRTLEAELQRDALLQLAIDEVALGLLPPDAVERARTTRDASRSRASAATRMDPDAIERYIDRPAPGARGVGALKLIKGLIVVAARVIARYVRGRDHGFHATVVEEILREFYVGPIGGWVWARLQQHTADAFTGDPTTASGLVLLDAIAAAVDAGAPVPRVTLVGHSTGAIWIAHCLAAAAERQLPPALGFDVVFLAPAISCELMATAVLAGSASARLRHYRSFAMRDDLERTDAVVPPLAALYPSSLLYLVSGVFEPEADTPLVGMARYHDAAHYPVDRFPAAHAVRRIVHPVAPVTVWSDTPDDAPAGRRSHATTHSSFDEDEATLASLRHLLAHGF